MDLTYTEHSIQKQQDTHSSQSNMKHFLEYMMLGHKTNQQRRWKSYQAFFPSDYNGVKLEINYKKKTGKLTNRWLLNSMLLSNQWVKEENKRAAKN